MADFIVLSAHGDGRETTDRIRQIVTSATEMGWQERFADRGVVILTSGNGSLEVQWPPHGRLILLGDWRSEQTLLDATARNLDPIGLSLSLTQKGWGRYVALSLRPGGRLAGVYRDPSGAMDCFVATDDGLTLVMSSAEAWLHDLLGASWKPDWDRVADILADATVVTGRSAVSGVTAVMAGAFQAIGQGQMSPPVQVWDPTSFTRSASMPLENARQSLVSAIDTAVAAVAGPGTGCLMEVSGGLDSAIVASSLDRQAPSVPFSLINYFGPHAEADERLYARAVADLMGQPLTTSSRDRPVEVAKRWMQDRLAFRPGFNRLDPDYDDAQAALAKTLGHGVILTGKGGDAVLFQHATPLVFADVIEARGLMALRDPRLFEVARWCRRSIWNVATVSREALKAGRRNSASGGRPALAFTAAGLSAATRHPWLEKLEGVAPAKRIQIGAIASNLGLHGPSPQTDAADVFHPLLSQPVLEAALSISTIDLTEGGRDRGLARNAFVGRIPEAIRLRKTKGGLSHYFGQAIVDGLDDLKPFLLDGLLAQHGLIDRDSLEAALTPDVMVWKSVYGDLMLLTMVEAWARRWEDASSMA